MSKNKLFIISALLLTSICFAGCGDTVIEKRKTDIPRVSGMSGSLLSTETANVIDVISKMDSVQGICNVSVKAAEDIENRGWGGILSVVETPETCENDMLSSSLKLESQDFSSVGVMIVRTYPETMDITPSFISYSLSCKDLKGLDVAFASGMNNEMSKLDAVVNNESVKFNIGAFSPVYMTISGRLSVVKTETVTGNTQGNVSKGLLTMDCKYGIETDTTNPYILNVVSALVGAKTLRPCSVIVDYAGNKIDYSYSQEVVTFALTSGERTFNFKAYALPVVTLK